MAFNQSINPILARDSSLLLTTSQTYQLTTHKVLML